MSQPPFLFAAEFRGRPGQDGADGANVLPTDEAMTEIAEDPGSLFAQQQAASIAARAQTVFPVSAQPAYAGAYPADSSAAVNQAIAAAVAAGGGIVMLPYGRSKWNSAITPIPTTVSVLGYGGGTWNTNAATVITVAAGVNGIDNRGQKNRINDFFIESLDAGVGSSVGVFMRGSEANYDNTTVSGFGSHGYQCDASVGVNGFNANVTRAGAIRAVGCGGYGLYIAGTDTNVLTAHVDMTLNKLGGVYCAAQKTNITGHLADNSPTTGATIGKGNWVTLTAYNIGDAVWSGGVQYVALVAISAANTTAPAIGASWGAGGSAIVDAGYSNKYSVYIEAGTGDRIVATGNSVGMMVDVSTWSGGVFDDSLAADAIYINDSRIWNKGYWRKKIGIADDTASWYFGVARALAAGTFDLYNVSAAKRILQIDAAGTNMAMGVPIIPTTAAQTLAANGAVTINAASGDATVTLQANATSSSITNAVTNQVLTITWVQDATGGRTYVWPTNCVFTDGASPSYTTASKRLSVTFKYDGTNWNEQSRTVPTVRQSGKRTAVGGGGIPGATVATATFNFSPAFAGVPNFTCTPVGNHENGGDGNCSAWIYTISASAVTVKLKNNDPTLAQTLDLYWQADYTP